MRRQVLVAVAATALLMSSTSLSADAAASVKINRIGTKTAPYKGKVTIKPSISASGSVKIEKKLLTVTRNGKTVASGVRQASLPAGTYNVRQYVKFRTYSLQDKRVVRVRPNTRVLGYLDTPVETNRVFVNTCQVKQIRDDGTYTAACGIRMYDSNYNTPLLGQPTLPSSRIQLDPYDVPSEFRVGQWIRPEAVRVSSTLYKTVKQRVYAKARAKRSSHSLVVKAGAKPRTCATKADFDRVQYDFDDPEYYGDSKSTVAKKLHNAGTTSSYSDYGDYVIEFRKYRTCSDGAILSVGFFNGYAYAKSYYA